MSDMKTLDQITQADVLKVYSGRPGCCCGCRGNYSYADNSAAQAEAQDRKGQINTAQVTRVLNVLRSNTNTAAEPNHNFYYLDLENRTYILYLHPHA